MSKIIRTRKPSVLPYYAAALAFVVLCAVLPVYRLWALLAALGAAVLAFAGAKKICPPRVVETEVPFHTGVDDVDAMLTEMQQQLDTLHALNEALPDPQLSAAMARMEKAGRSIVETVEATPAKAKQVRRFANYYLPDAVNVLQQYAKLAKQGVRRRFQAPALRPLYSCSGFHLVYSRPPKKQGHSTSSHQESGLIAESLSLCHSLRYTFLFLYSIPTAKSYHSFSSPSNGT